MLVPEHKLSPQERVKLYGREPKPAAAPEQPRAGRKKSAVPPEPPLDAYAIPGEPPRGARRNRRARFVGASQATLDALLRIASWEAVFGSGSTPELEARMAELRAAGAKPSPVSEAFVPNETDEPLLATAKALKSIYDTERVSGAA